MTFCRCDAPQPEWADGRELCAGCGERIPDPLLWRLLREVVALRRQVEALRGGDADDPVANEMLTTAEAAARLGVSPRYMSDHADELGAVRYGNGPRARLHFPASVIEEKRRAKQ